MKKCKYCGEEIQDKAKKCRYCGEWFEKDNNTKYEFKKEEEVNEDKKDKYIEKEKVIDLENEIKKENEEKGIGITKNKSIGLKRLGFNIGLLVIFLIAVGIEVGEEGAGQGIWLLGLMLLSIFRFKNLGRSGWYSLGLLVPFYGLYLLLLLIFYKEDNQEKTNPILLWVVGFFILSILGTIIYFAFQGYSEAEKQAVEIEEQNSNISIKLNDWLEINNSNKLINEKFDKETLKGINEEAEKGFLTNNGNYLLVIPEIIDGETAKIYADEKNNNQNKLGLKSIVLGMGGKKIISEIKKVDGINFYIFKYEINFEGDLYYYYAIFGGKDLNFENIYLWGTEKGKVKEDGEFLVNHIKVNNYEK